MLPIRPHPAASRCITALALLGCSLLGARAGWAEGAVRLLACTSTRVCDAGGSCTDETTAVSFRLEPKEIEAGGGGVYELRLGDMQADVMAVSDTGPFFWTLGRERHALIVSSETEWLWHRLVVDATPEATIRFLSCSFSQ